MYKIIYPADLGFEVRLHPVNQSGSSSRQFSDLDVFLHGEPYLGTELKDKPFTRSDVDHAVKTSTKANIKGMLFIAGRMSEFESQTKEYFDSVQAKWMKKNIKIGVMSINALVDFVFVTKTICAPALLKDLLNDAKTIGNTEVQLWLYAQVRKIES